MEKNIFSILNIYAPNDLKLRNIFFKSIDQLLKEFFLGIKLVAGDYNQTLSHIDRISKNKSYSNNSTSGLHKLIKSHKLNDIWRDMNKNKSQYTWLRLNSIEKSRIDFWLTDANIRPAIFKTDIRPAQIKYTDHLAVSLKIINLSKRGPNFWKMNNSYLKDKTYMTLINKTIDQCVAQ